MMNITFKGSKINIEGKELKVGDKVLFPKYAGNEIKFEGTEYTVLSQGDILAVIEE